MLVFLCLAALVVFVCSRKFSYADAEHSENIMKDFYQLEENTVDCIFLGTSASQRAYNVPVGFHDYGVAAYTMACGTQPFMLTKYLMIEAQKTQDPKVFVIELRGTTQGKDKIWDVAVRRMIDNMKMSQNKRDAIKAVTKYAEGGDNSVDTSGWSYYFPLLKYHGRWNPSKQPKYSNNVIYYNGFAVDKGVVFRTTEVRSLEYSDYEAAIAEETVDALNDLLDYCDSIDAKVLFVLSPYEASKYGMERLNTSKKIVEERGYECINFIPIEKKEELGLDDRTCYYNREHLNYFGALKYTDFMSKYLKDNYDVPDRRGDSRYAGYEELYDKLMENMKGDYAERYAEMMAAVESVEQ